MLSDTPRRPFAVAETTRRRTGGEGKRAPVAVAAASGDGDDGSPLFAPGGGGESDLPPGFNPFDRTPLSSERGVDSLSLASVRKLKMKKVMDGLLRSANDDEAMDAVLTDSEDFLCEQLNDLDAVLDGDSIYEPDMGREERYRRYGEVMDERIGQARDSTVRKILERMKDYVMAYDERHA